MYNLAYLYFSILSYMSNRYVLLACTTTSFYYDAKKTNMFCISIWTTIHQNHKSSFLRSTILFWPAKTKRFIKIFEIQHWKKNIMIYYVFLILLWNKIRILLCDCSPLAPNLASSKIIMPTNSKFFHIFSSNHHKYIITVLDSFQGQSMRENIYATTCVTHYAQVCWHRMIVWSKSLIYALYCTTFFCR